MPDYVFQQVDVFAGIAFGGNPLAVVCNADQWSDAQMAAFARWTNLSETVFLQSPCDAQADYRARIFTPGEELPFAGHPTLGACAVWLANGGQPKGEDIVQECGAGLVPVRQLTQCDQPILAFRAPPLRRAGAVDAETLARARAALRLPPEAVLDASWADNGPGWIAMLLRSRDDVLGIKPDYTAMNGLALGVVGLKEQGAEGEPFAEVRAFWSEGEGVGREDPVTGSLNAALGVWLISSKRAPAHYIASQGTAMGRTGRVFVSSDESGVWVGGVVGMHIAGTLRF